MTTSYKTVALRICTEFLLLPMVLVPSKLKGYWSIQQHAKACWALSVVAPGSCIGTFLYPDPHVFLSAANKIEEMGYTKVARPRSLAAAIEGQKLLDSPVTEAANNGNSTFTGYSEGETAPLATIIACPGGQATTFISDLPADKSTGIKRWPIKAEISAQCVNPIGYTILSLTNE